MGADVVTREELYELVWSTPMTKVAEKFQVSGSYMARVCTELRVPRPERGYWAKLEVGKAGKAPPLPEPEPGDPQVWSRSGGMPVRTSPVPTSLPTISPRRRPKRAVTGTHGLIRGAKEHFLGGRDVKENDYLKPYKKLLVDVTASSGGLDKALDFANKLFNALESAGHRVVIAPSDVPLGRESVYEKEAEPEPRKDRQRNYYSYGGHWSPQRPTVVYVDSLVFGLSIVEMTESVAVRYVDGKYIRESEYVPSKATLRYMDRSWTSTHDLPSGRLRLIIYSPYRNVSWSINFQETKTRRLDSDISKVIKTLENSVPTLIELLQEAERKEELWRKEWLADQERRRQEEDRRHEAQSIKDSQEHLEQVILAWSKAFSLGQFFQGVEDQAALLPEDERQKVLERLKLAREFIGTQNPLDFFLGWRTPLERYVPLALREKDSDTHSE